MIYHVYEVLHSRTTRKTGISCHVGAHKEIVASMVIVVNERYNVSSMGELVTILLLCKLKQINL